MGWCSFTSNIRAEVVLAELTAFEWSGGEAGIAAAIARLNRELDRDDLVHINVRYGQVSPSAKGMSFQEFKKVYRPMRAYYSSRSGLGESTWIRKESLEEFGNSGGVIAVTSPTKSPERTRDT